MWTQFTPISLYLCLAVIGVVSGHSLRSAGQLCDNTTICAQNLLCHQNRCKCPLGYGLDNDYNTCVKFEDFVCDRTSECNAYDHNRVCIEDIGKCMCNHLKGYFEPRDSKLCQRHEFLNNTCVSDDDCPIEYSHCRNGRCRCWPEFQPKVDKVPVTKYRLLIFTVDKHSCTRKICSANSDCQTADNPNLICNNTICECEYGYGVDTSRVCVKISRRQNCNITCQIIGGLFASIFMLSLIYWCFYCCYSIVKNYKEHSRRSESHSSHMVDDSPLSHRFIRTHSAGSRPHRDSGQNFSINSDDRFYYFDGQTPPTYSQLSDDPPDYETVVHMKATND